MTINFYLDSKSNSKDEKAVYCFVRGLGKTIYLNTGKKINPKFWNQDKQCVRKTFVGHPEFNTFLSDLKAAINKRYTLLTSQDLAVSYDDMKSEIMKIFEKEEKKAGFFDVLDIFCDTKKTAYSNSMLCKYRSLRNLLTDFQEKKKYSVSFRNIDLL